MNITQANKEQASQIAKLIMMAMNYECCQNLAGPHHTLAEFEELMTALVKMEHTQYSYRNTLVALDPKQEVVGICVSYNGAELHSLRQAFIDGAQKNFDMNHHDMIDEAQPDELYIDSLAVNPDMRGLGIAKLLIQKTLVKAQNMGIQKIGLLVDKGNPRAEKLYTTQGFQYMGDTSWGGHAMKHLQYHTMEIKTED